MVGIIETVSCCGAVSIGFDFFKFSHALTGYCRYRIDTVGTVLILPAPYWLAFNLLFVLTVMGELKNDQGLKNEQVFRNDR